VLDSPSRAVLVHGDLHGDNQVWDRSELRLVVDFENVGATEPRDTARVGLPPVDPGSRRTG
jgi:aminoglycoside phosphotransferase (APT) family kinase protein